MSTETLLPLAGTLPAGHPAASPATAATPATPSLQERRLRAARELETRICRLEQETLQLAAALQAARHGSREHLGELQQRSASLTTEVLRVGARLARQGRDQAEQRRLLEHRLCAGLRDLESALPPLREALRTQAAQLEELQSRHETLQRLHEHLDRIVARQGRGLDIVAAEFEQRVELLRVGLEGIQALFRDQQQSQMRIAVEQEGLSALAQALQLRIDDSRAEIHRHREETRRQMWSLTGLLLAVALLSLALLAWCQLHPVALPVSARQQLTELDNRLMRQAGSTEALSRAVNQQADALDRLHHDLQQMQQDNRRLRAEAKRQRTRLTRMIALTRAAPSQRTETGASIHPPLDAHTVTPPGTAGSASIALPTALPGSRPDF